MTNARSKTYRIDMAFGANGAIIKETPRAWLWEVRVCQGHIKNVATLNVWLPKSQVRKIEGECPVFVVPAWLIAKKGLWAFVLGQ